MPLITEDEVRRVVNNLADGKAKGIDSWSPAELREHYREHTSTVSLTSLTMLKSIRDGHMAFALSLPSSPNKVQRTKDQSGPLPFCRTFIECGWQSGK
eukprot:14051706-Heterocapsa_arctica.AAC.1